MAWELVYTSAPKGLASGSTGFCTVAHSRGLPVSLQPRLEALSGYRPLPQSYKQSVLPVRYSHVLLHHAGERLSVLSRVSSVGVDHTGRTNKLADHRVVPPNERAPAGPAWVIGQSEVFRDHWCQEPSLLEASTSVPSGDQPPGVCEGWAQSTGDAGWGGYLIDRFLLDPAAPVYVVYEPGRHDPLKLVLEAIALLPVARRWDVTFSTYYTDPLGDHNVAWRFVVAGTPAAEAVATLRGQGGCVDLTATIKPAAESAYVLAARTGVMPKRVIETEAQADAAADDHATASDKSVSGYEERSAHAARASIAVHAEQDRSAVAELSDAVAQGPPRHRSPWVWLMVIVATFALLLMVLYTASGISEQADAQPTAAAEVSELERQLDQAMQRIAELEGRFDNETQPPLGTNKPADAPAGTGSFLRLPTTLGGDDTDATTSDRAGPQHVPDDAEAEARSGLMSSVDVRGVLPDLVAANAGSGSMGSTRRLLESEQWLWRPDQPVPASARLSVTASWDEARSDLSWRVGEREALLVCRSLDALGMSKDVTLGGLTLSSEGLRWAWTDAEVPRTWSTRHEALWWHIAASRVVIQGSSKQVLATVRLADPNEVSCVIDGRPASIPWRAAGVPIALRFEPPGPSWSVTTDRDGHLIRLLGSAGSRLILTLTPAADHFGFRAGWERSAETIREERLRVRERLRVLDGWMGKRDTLRLRAREKADALPRQEDGAIDHEQRGHGRHREAFEAYDLVQQELDLHEEMKPSIELDTPDQEHGWLEQEADRLGRELDEHLALDGVLVRVVAARSGVVVGVIRIRPEDAS